MREADPKDYGAGDDWNGSTGTDDSAAFKVVESLLAPDTIVRIVGAIGSTQSRSLASQRST
jgi:hypothetical protein